MKKISIKYSMIDHEFRLQWGLSFSEVVFLDSVYKLQNNTVLPGWCYASNKHFEMFLGYTDRGIRKIKARLIEKNLIEEGQNSSVSTKLLRTTERYNAHKRGERERVKEEQSSRGEERRGEGEELSSGEGRNLVPKREEQSSANSSNYKSSSYKREKEARKKSDEPDGSLPPLIKESIDNLTEKDSKEVLSQKKKRTSADFKREAKEFYPAKGAEPDKGSRVYPSWLRFEEAWQEYPAAHRGSKITAWAAWQGTLEIEGELKPEDVSATERIKTHIRDSRLTKNWQEGFVPHMVTYLNQYRWEEEAVPAPGLKKREEPEEKSYEEMSEEERKKQDEFLEYWEKLQKENEAKKRGEVSRYASKEKNSSKEE